VYLCVCLSVSRISQKLRTDFYEIIWRGGAWPTEESIRPTRRLRFDGDPNRDVARNLFFFGGGYKSFWGYKTVEYPF